MAELPRFDRSLRRVIRRIRIVRAVESLPWCILGVATIAALLVVVGKYRGLVIETTTLYAVATGTAFVTAALSAWIRGTNHLSAALELDRRCELDERISSAIAAQTARAENSSVAKAVQADAERALNKVDVVAVFPIVALRYWAQPLVPAVVMIALAIWFTPTDIAPKSDAAKVVAAQRKASAANLQKRLVEKQKTAEELKLTQAKDLLEKLRDETRHLQTDGRLDKKESLIRLNELAQRFAERRSTVEVPAELSQPLSRLNIKEPGPAERFSQSLARKDFRNAAQQLQRLREQLQSDGLSDEQKSQLGKQFDELQDQLADRVQRGEQRGDESGKQVATKSEKSSSLPDDQSIAKESGGGDDSLRSTAEKTDSLKQLRQSLQKASEKMEQGDADAAQQSLSDLQNQLQKLSSQNDEQQLLDQAMNDLADAKTQIGGKEEAGNAEGDEDSRITQDRDDAGLGERPGEGGLKPGVSARRPENPSVEGGARLVDLQVPTEVGAGALQVTGSTGGRNAKGRALEAIRGQADALANNPDSQPVANQILDRSRRAQKREYFDALRTNDY